jgi:hypothetical protein
MPLDDFLKLKNQMFYDIKLIVYFFSEFNLNSVILNVLETICSHQLKYFKEFNKS